jgi:hypothetical protein
MRVGELIAILEQLPLDKEVVIPVKSSQDTVGGTPCTKIRAIYDGFDWDSGTVQIWTEDVLVRFTPLQLEEFKVMQQEARMVRRDTWIKCRDMSPEQSAEELQKAELDVHPILRVKRN